MKLPHTEHETYNEREETALEHAVEAHWDDGASLLKHLPGKKDTGPNLFFPELQGAIFCGHLVTDLDSIAGSIGAVRRC